MAELTAQTYSHSAICGLGCGRKPNGQREGEVRERLEFGQDSAICLGEEPIFVISQKCPYHVTFDLDLDLEHILDAGPSGDHRMQVWSRSSHLPARTSDFREVSAPITCPLTSILTLSTSWMQADLRTIVYKFGRDPAICPREEAIFVT